MGKRAVPGIIVKKVPQDLKRICHTPRLQQKGTLTVNVY